MISGKGKSRGNGRWREPLLVPGGLRSISRLIDWLDRLDRFDRRRRRSSLVARRRRRCRRRRRRRRRQAMFALLDLDGEIFNYPRSSFSDYLPLGENCRLTMFRPVLKRRGFPYRSTDNPLQV